MRLKLLVFTISVKVLILGAQIPVKMPDTNNNGPTVCTTKNNLEGICVPEMYCTEDFKIAPGGIIEEDELRKSSCSYQQWCCTLDNVVKKPKVQEPKKKCETDNRLSCPWCASLHRSITLDIKKTGLFCGGVLIGSKAVLSLATCDVVSKRHKYLWATLPHSPYPQKNYTVVSRHRNDAYNSGSQEFNFALFILNEEITLTNSDFVGACLNLESTFPLTCFGFGYDDNDKIIRTDLKVKPGRCADGQGPSDVACATPTSSQCLVSSGTPVICPSDSSRNILVYGIAMTPCRPGWAHIGAISKSSDWLIATLEQYNIPLNSVIL